MNPSTLINLAGVLAGITFSMTVASATLTIISLKRAKKNKIRIDALASLVSLFMELQDGETPENKDIEKTAGLIDMLKPKTNSLT